MNDSENDNSNQEEQPSKKRSLVWQFFEKISRHRVRCRLCEHEQNYQGTTGNILRHLKARHDLDATIKGQQDPKNQQRIKDLGGIMTPIKTEIKIERKQRSHKATECELSVDPYDHDNQETFENTNLFYENFAELKEDCLDEDDRPFQSNDRKAKLEEDRIIAETEYFREKAAYFRFQKHFTALQAKKIKLEIEQLSTNKNKDETYVNK